MTEQKLVDKGLPSPESTEAKQKVLAAWPDADSVWGCTRWEILSPSFKGGRIVLGTGQTEDEAWSNTAQTLPKPASQAAPVPAAPSAPKCRHCGQFKAMHKGWKWCAVEPWATRSYSFTPDDFSAATRVEETPAAPTERHYFRPDTKFDCMDCAEPINSIIHLAPAAPQDRGETPLLSERVKELEKAYRWKAENNIRFYEKLGMTTEQKVEFLAKEFATVHWLVEIDAPSIRHLASSPVSKQENAADDTVCLQCGLAEFLKLSPGGNYYICLKCKPETPRPTPESAPVGDVPVLTRIGEGAYTPYGKSAGYYDADQVDAFIAHMKSANQGLSEGQRQKLEKIAILLSRTYRRWTNDDEIEGMLILDASDYLYRLSDPLSPDGAAQGGAR